MTICKDDKSLSSQSNRRGRHLHRIQDHHQLTGIADFVLPSTVAEQEGLNACNPSNGRGMAVQLLLLLEKTEQENISAKSNQRRALRPF